MISILKYFVEKSTLKIIGLLLNFFVHKNKKYIALGLRTPKCTSNSLKDYFMHNTKYLFLYLMSQNKLKAVYLCDDTKILSKFKKCGFKNIYKRKSLKGLFYSLISKYWAYDDSKLCINNMILSGKTIGINLWHGIPLKKIGYDINDNIKNLKPAIFKIFDLIKQKDSYYIVNSEYEQSCYETAFLTSKDNIKIIGSPRLDVLLHDIPHSDLFMEEDFANIKSFKEQGKKLFFYTPTFRDTGKDISGWLKSDRLRQFLKDNNAILVCKLHFADKNSLNFDLPKEFYKMDSDSDIYPVLKYSDALITDYSSIYFDYLLLDKPILYYPIDLEEYQEKCRGFYRPYEDLTAGVKAYNEDELVSAMNDVINEVDNYKEKRKLLRDKMFKYQDGKNCERVVEWVRSLDK